MRSRDYLPLLPSIAYEAPHTPSPLFKYSFCYLTNTKNPLSNDNWDLIGCSSHFS